MKPRFFPPGCVALVISTAVRASCACSVHTGLQAGAAMQAGSMLPETPATPLPDEKIRQLHPGRYGLVLQAHQREALENMRVLNFRGPCTVASRAWLHAVSRGVAKPEAMRFALHSLSRP